MQKILITGSTGMVGRNIVEFEKFKKNYILLTPSHKELNLLDKKLVDEYIEINKPDIIIHCAGKVGGIHTNMLNQVEFLTENIQIGLNIIMSAYKNRIKKLINMSSSCMYPRDAINPLKEDFILTGVFEPTNEGYAIAKVTSTRLCEYINKENIEYRYKTIIPCNLYGRYDKFDPKHSHMLPAVIKKIHDAKINNQKTLDIWGDGKARRECMYVEDLADFTYYALEDFEQMPQNINVGLGCDYTISEYYQVIAEIIGYKGRFVYDLSKPVGMKQKVIDDTKLQKLGWKYKTSLKDGVQKTYDYYLKDGELSGR